MRLLLVDDHADFAAVTAALLRNEGFEVRIASSGREALKIAAEFQPRVILCDLNLPDMEGREVIRALRLDPSTRGAYIAVLTAMWGIDRSHGSMAEQLGADAFLSKPITIEAIRKLAGPERANG